MKTVIKTIVLSAIISISSIAQANAGGDAEIARLRELYAGLNGDFGFIDMAEMLVKNHVGKIKKAMFSFKVKTGFCNSWNAIHNQTSKDMDRVYYNINGNDNFSPSQIVYRTDNARSDFIDSQDPTEQMFVTAMYCTGTLASTFK